MRSGYDEHATIGKLVEVDTNLEDFTRTGPVKEAYNRPEGRDPQDKGEAIQEGPSGENALRPRT